MLKSIEKLREWRNVPDSGYWSDEIIGHADAIEREIAERYMLLPVDANGEQWGEADKAFYAKGENFARRLAGFSYACEEGRWLLEDGDGCTFYADECRHVKPATIESLLEEFADLPERIDRIAAVPRFADKLRELLGGDEK